jgi:guanine deaminase
MNSETDIRARRLTLAGTLSLLIAPRIAAAAAPPDIVQPERPSPEAFMNRAFAAREEAVRAGDQSYGAVMVKDARIVGWGPSRVVVDRDPTAHAEMQAIRDAARRLDTRDLTGCVIYATSRPCAMCETALYWAGAQRIVHGAALIDVGAPRYPSC